MPHRQTFVGVEVGVFLVGVESLEVVTRLAKKLREQGGDERFAAPTLGLKNKMYGVLHFLSIPFRSLLG
jgi:hypothetical protein